MSYTIKSLQKALALLEGEFQELDQAVKSKNHIHDMYAQFQHLAEKHAALQQAQKVRSLELD